MFWACSILRHRVRALFQCFLLSQSLQDGGRIIKLEEHSLVELGFFSQELLISYVSICFLNKVL